MNWYSVEVWPSGVLTMIVTVFSPVTRPEAPTISTTASASSVSTSTSTSVVPASSSMVSPTDTSWPSTMIEEIPVFSGEATFKVTT